MRDETGSKKTHKQTLRKVHVEGEDAFFLVISSSLEYPSGMSKTYAGERNQQIKGPHTTHTTVQTYTVP